MTKGTVALPFRLDNVDDEQQVPPLRSPGFPVEQEIRVRSGRDDTSGLETLSSFQDELSSRPERSVAEGSAVRPSAFPNSQSSHAPSLAPDTK